MRKVTGHFMSGRLLAPRFDCGADFEAGGWVLVDCGAVCAKNEKLRLVWRQGGRGWNGNYMPRIGLPAHLQVIGRRDGSGHWDWTTIFEGGRLSRVRIGQHLPAIREALRLPGLAMEHIDLQRTFVVTKPKKKGRK